MPFGVCNGPATFPREMDFILAPVKGLMALIYLDKIIVYANTFDEYLVHLDIVLGLMQKAGLKLQPKKCTFAMRQLKFLGHVVDREGIVTVPSLIKSILY